MPNKDLITAFIAALLSSGLFLFISGFGLIFFLFIPTLPLLTLGLGKGAHLSLTATLFATALITLGGSIPAALFFLCILGLPAWYITKQALISRMDGETREWFPVGLILTHLTLYACALVALANLYFASGEGLPAMLADHIRVSLAGLEAEYSDVIELMVKRAFLMFSIIIWMWSIMFYGHAWLANRVLVQKNMSQRPSFAIEPFTLPGWMISLLLICALAVFIGSPNMRFVGQATLASLLLPYFFAGIGIMHAASKTWPSRGFLLFFIYFAAFLFLWPALILAAIGFFHQIKHLSGAGTSSRS